uniref:Uncharacterized protein n=1 Tax=Amazona collaria TaxID=241587 RepID=A0A8B9F3D9_9PSIT
MGHLAQHGKWHQRDGDGEGTSYSCPYAMDQKPLCLLLPYDQNCILVSPVVTLQQMQGWTMCLMCTNMVCTDVVCNDVVCTNMVCTDVVCNDVVCSDVMCADVVCSHVPCTDMVCNDVVCSDVMCTDVVCTDVPCTDAVCTDVPCIDTACTDVMCTDVPCTDVPCTDVVRTDVPCHWHAWPPLPLPPPRGALLGQVGLEHSRASACAPRHSAQPCAETLHLRVRCCVPLAQVTEQRLQAPHSSHCPSTAGTRRVASAPTGRRPLGHGSL